MESLSTIAIKAQISGELTQVQFQEGDEVAEGQVLFTIDPRPYEVALAQAEANLAKAGAQVEQSRASKAKSKVVADNAQVELDRNVTNGHAWSIIPPRKPHGHSTDPLPLLILSMLVTADPRSTAVLPRCFPANLPKEIILPE